MSSLGITGALEYSNVPAADETKRYAHTEAVRAPVNDGLRNTGTMTTPGSDVASPPLKLPKLSPVETSSAAVAVSPQQHKPTKRTVPRGSARDTAAVVGDITDQVTAARMPSRRSSLPLPLPRRVGGDHLAQGSQGGSLAPNGPLQRRRSGDFSLPVRYKVSEAGCTLTCNDHELFHSSACAHEELPRPSKGACYTNFQRDALGRRGGDRGT